MSEKDISQSILKAASIIKSFNSNELELSIAHISQKIGIPNTTARRMAVTLAMTGLLEQSTTKGRYKIGPALYIQGNLYLQASHMLTEIRLVTRTLSELTGETITASVFDKDKVFVTYFIVENSKHPLIWNIQIGTSMPAYASAMGRAFLSELTDDEIDSLFPKERLRTVAKGEIDTKTKLKTEIAKIRKTGISFGYREDMVGVSSLIRSVSGEAVAGINITVPAIRMNEAKREKYALLLKLGASLASYRLGYYDTSNPVHNVDEIRSWWQQNQMISVTQVAGST